MTREQFISLVETTREAFRRFLVALCCGDKPLADDIAQESYLKAYVACNTVSDPLKFNSWLYRIGYNTFIDSKRAARSFDDIDQARTLTADDETDRTFKYQDLYRALNLLTPKERTSVLLYYLEGYSIKEIAQLENISENAVKQHLSRGRNHLRGLLSSPD